MKPAPNNRYAFGATPDSLAPWLIVVVSRLWRRFEGVLGMVDPKSGRIVAATRTVFHGENEVVGDRGQAIDRMTMTKLAFSA